MRNWILKLLKKFIDWLLIQHTKYLPKRYDELPYNSLSPTENAEKVEDYLKTIEWTLKNRNKIKNIAVAGPFGSGKSSVIQTFQKKNEHNKDFHFLNISLATFKDEKDPPPNGVKNDILRLIELSILQQLFYHEEDNKIPDSRFKKIKSHKNHYLFLLTIGFIAFIVSFFYLVFPEFLEKFSLIKLNQLYTSVFHYISVAIVLFGSVFAIFKSIRALKGLSIKKFGIHNAEIEIDNDISKSILNNHIDEILYFFEVTIYNVVIIEDLDRFEQTEVFTKLREINLLINKSKKIKRDVVFIYAIRDDMFQDNDRTKFFDFMIPIIPVINSSNSNEKILKIVETEGYNVSTVLIEDISLFIDDMRLLYNIMNEYHIYSNKLNSTLDQDKLLSMVTYKNIYPIDFTNLSQNDGVVYSILASKHKYINDKINLIENEISRLKLKIENAKSLAIRDQKELKSVYLSKYIEKTNLSSYPFSSFEINGSEVNFKQALEDKHFNSFINNSVTYKSSYYSKRFSFKFEDVEKEIDSNQSFQERRELIADSGSLEDYKNKIEELEEEKRRIKKYKLKDLISADEIKLDVKNQKQRELVNVLLRNGYIDEGYFDYISIFYEGSLSKNDHQFLINVKTQRENEFDYLLQKKENLIKRINEFEFEKEYLLNYDLIDFLIKSSKYSAKRKKVFTQLSNESESSIRFVDGFISHTANIEKFMRYLCKDWVGIWNFIESKSNYPKEKADNYFKLIIEHSEVNDIKNIFDNSKNRITDNKDFLLITKNTNKLKEIIVELNIKFNVLDETAPQELIDFIYNNYHYSLNTNVVKYLLKIKKKLNINTFDTKNYTAIQQSKLDKLIDYVEDNIDEYISSIYLNIETNTTETDEYYIKLLNNEKISNNNKLSVINKVETKINDINEIEEYTTIKLLLNASKVLPAWRNLIDIYIQSENEIINEMTSFLNTAENTIELSKTRIKTDAPDEETVDKFLNSLLLNNDIENEDYSRILSSIPYIYDSLDFENLSFEKVELLIRKNKLTTNATNFKLLRNNFENLHVLLIENNPNNFIKEIDSYELQNEELFDLLKSKTISIQIKEKIIESFDTTMFTLDSVLLTQIGILLLDNSNLDINNEIILAVGTDSDLKVLDKIRIFNKWNRIYNKEDITTFLISLEEPYSLIAENGKRPLIDNNHVNRDFIPILQVKGYISKYAIEKRKGIRISTFRNK